MSKYIFYNHQTLTDTIDINIYNSYFKNKLIVTYEGGTISDSVYDNIKQIKKYL